MLLHLLSLSHLSQLAIITPFAEQYCARTIKGRAGTTYHGQGGLRHILLDHMCTMSHGVQSDPKARTPPSALSKCCTASTRPAVQRGDPPLALAIFLYASQMQDLLEA